tara:strand:+ start:1267 stop:1542 length:276 start_codon:yes stop_codon:yes gene_type:complete
MNITDFDDDTSIMIVKAAQQAVALMPKTEEGTEIGLVVGGIAAAVCSVIYAMKHIKSSSCWGFSCKQEVESHTPVVICRDGQPAVRMQSEV